MTPSPLSTGWELKFRLACSERRGDNYQDLFVQIMERRDPGFQRVRPWGNVGDRKNDGWSPARRMLFQCYAPAAMSMANLEAKLEDDYEGAVDYWEEYFDSWVFVHNDLDGMAPAIAKKIVELDGRSDHINCTAWGISELREEFAHLSDAHRAAILGPALTPHDFLAVDAETIRPMLEAMGHMQPDPAAAVGAVPPDKIEGNELRESQVEFLGLGSSRAPLVENYLSNAFLIPSHADQIAAAVKDRYRAIRDAGRSPAETFDELLAWICGGSVDSNVLANGLAVLAYFFERCHIFEIPGGST